jgi:hypothetical protein
MTSIGCQASDTQNAEIDEHPISEILPQQDQHVDSDATHVLQAEVVGDEEQEAIEEQIYEEEHPLPVHHPLADTAPPVVPDQAADHHQSHDESSREQPVSAHHTSTTVAVDGDDIVAPVGSNDKAEPQAVEESVQSGDATTPDTQQDQEQRAASTEQPEQVDQPQAQPTPIQVVYPKKQKPHRSDRQPLHIALATIHGQGHLTPFMALAKELTVKYPQAKISLVTYDVCVCQWRRCVLAC